MLRRTQRASILGVALLLVAAGCTARSEGEAGTPEPRGEARVVELDGGGRVVIPAESFPEGTDVTVSTEGAPSLPTARKGLAAPIDITADGRQPSVPVTLEFPYDPSVFPDGTDLATVMGVSTYDETTGRWEPLEVTFDTGRNTMVAVSPTLSWKWPWQWDWVAIQAGINQRAGELVGKRAPAAVCPRGTGLPPWVQGASTSNDDAIALRTCAESDRGALVIEMVNNRPYGVVMDLDAPTRWRWRAQPEDPSQLLAMLTLDAILPADQLYVPPLGRASIGLRKGEWQRAELRTDATAATVIATYLSLAFGDVVTKETAKVVAGALAGSCLSGFIKSSASASLESMGDVQNLLTSSMSCASQALESRALDRALTPGQRGRAAGAYKGLGRVAGWLTVFSAEWDTVDLIFDKAFVGPASVPVLVRAPLLTASDEGIGEWAFGDPAGSVLTEMNDWFGQPDHDSGFDEFVQHPEFGDGWFAPGGDQLSPRWSYRFFRVACWQSLCSIFGGDTVETAAFRGWELASGHAWTGYTEVDTSEPRIALAGTGIQVGDTWADFLEAYPESRPGGGEGNSLVIDDTPWPGIFDGVGAWRLTGTWDIDNPYDAPPDAEITRMSGGVGPEPGCC